ncbi:MAG: hypothetical protein H0U74_22560 [Bradymonadaceae bacterium]|nr:hypothetical protein [Lujinxingiaceae bacterium]
MRHRQLLAHSRIVLVFLAALMFTVVGCEQEAATPIDEIVVDPSLPPAVVDLPPAPPASAYVILETNSDGSLRVAGLISNQTKHLGQSVEISAEIVSLSADCDPKKAKLANTECQEPHLVIKDNRDAEKQLLVVGYKEEFVKKAKLKVGDKHLFRGVYQKVAQGFVASEDGLLLLDAVGEHEVIAQK